MFCKICQNFMDITNIVGSQEKTQNGGNNDNTVNISSSSDFDITDDYIKNNENQAEQSLYQISDIISEQELNEIFGGYKKDGLNNELKDEDLMDADLSEIIKNPTFLKLSTHKKTMVINKFNEQTQKEIGKISKSTDSIVNKECYFYCKTCGYYEVIPDKTFIFSRGDEKKDDVYNLRFIKYKNDPTLPKTKKYTCINDKCSTHDEPKIKNAVFYRKKGSYITRYICTICDSYWDTFIEK